jgi:hypothetical protein
MSETSMSEPDRTIRRPDRNVSADSYRYSELTHWLAADPDRLAEALNRHQPAGSNCADCHRPWPCGMHRYARAALMLPFTMNGLFQRALERPIRNGHCWCGGTLDPPNRIRYWYPDQEPDGPERTVYGVVRHGEWPHRRRFERHYAPDRDYWVECGTDTRSTDTQLDWTDVGRCTAGIVHPVTAAWQDDDGHWLLDLTPAWPTTPEDRSTP